MNFKRGLIAGMLGTVAGALIPVLWIGGYTLLYWFWHDSPAMDREADLAYWQDYGAGPVIGLAIYFGLSAWATYTPPRKTSLCQHPGNSVSGLVSPDHFSGSGVSVLESTSQRYGPSDRLV